MVDSYRLHGWIYNLRWVFIKQGNRWKRMPVRCEDNGKWKKLEHLLLILRWDSTIAFFVSSMDYSC